MAKKFENLNPARQKRLIEAAGGNKKQAERKYNNRQNKEGASSPRIKSFRELGEERQARLIKRAGGSISDARKLYREESGKTTSLSKQISNLSGRVESGKTQIGKLKDKVTAKDERTKKRVDSLKLTIADLQKGGENYPDYSADLQALKEEQQQFLSDLETRALELEEQREKEFQTSLANTARAGLRPDFSIGTNIRRGMFGTSRFKRRGTSASTISQGIAASKTGTSVNI